MFDYTDVYPTTHTFWGFNLGMGDWLLILILTGLATYTIIYLLSGKQREMDEAVAREYDSKTGVWKAGKSLEEIKAEIDAKRDWSQEDGKTVAAFRDFVDWAEDMNVELDENIKRRQNQVNIVPRQRDMHGRSF